MIDASQAIRHQDHLTIPVPRSTTSTDSYDDVSIVSVVPVPLSSATNIRPQNHQQPPPSPPPTILLYRPSNPSRPFPRLPHLYATPIPRLSSHHPFPNPAPPKKRTADTAFPNLHPNSTTNASQSRPQTSQTTRRVKIEPSPPTLHDLLHVLPSRHPDIPEDGPKRKVFLERNRQAALKCRQRRNSGSELQGKVENMEEENEL
ncbi:hypothetical protein BC829DRAFT_52771 [Chytridium lagenaria]|nr:hypothetical protein BC829DRAFT_52771 [Chytridium lagenaria]